MEGMDRTILEIARQRTYLYDDDNKICYKWNCKAGCTLLKYLCLMHSPYKNEYLKHCSDSGLNLFESIAVFFWRNEIEFKQQKEKFNQYKKIYVHRNPITRFISCYNHLIYRNNYKGIYPEQILLRICNRDFDKKLKNPIDHVVCHLIPQNFKNDAHFFSTIDLESSEMHDFLSETYGNLYHEAQKKLEECGHHKHKKVLLRLKHVMLQKNLCEKIVLADDVKDIGL